MLSQHEVLCCVKHLNSYQNYILIGLGAEGKSFPLYQFLPSTKGFHFSKGHVLTMILFSFIFFYISVVSCLTQKISTKLQHAKLADWVTQFLDLLALLYINLSSYHLPETLNQ